MIGINVKAILSQSIRSSQIGVGNWWLGDYMPLECIGLGDDVDDNRGVLW